MKELIFVFVFLLLIGVAMSASSYRSLDDQAVIECMNKVCDSRGYFSNYSLPEGAILMGYPDSVRCFMNPGINP